MSMARRMNARQKSGKAPMVAQGAFDWWLLALVLMLLAIGVLMVFSASSPVAEQASYTLGDKYYFFKRQLIFVVISGVALVFVANMPRHVLYKLQYPFLFFCLLLLLLTLTPLGLRVNGAQRWLPFGPLSLQVLEFAKIALVLYLAYFMSAKQDLITTFSRGVIPPFFVTLCMAMLLLAQPDFGGAAILVMLLFFMCLVGGTRFIYLFISIGMAMAAAAALIVVSPYRARRLAGFLDPFKDAMDSGYQLVQSLYALGSGGFFGLGMGGSVQKMLYLPEPHTDFIISVIGEELGFIGLTAVMALFALLFARCYRIVLAQEDLRDKLSAFGVTLTLALGCVLNLAVVLGAAPPKGVAMPFLSYGGSSLLASMICIGLMLNFSRTAKSS